MKGGGWGGGEWGRAALLNVCYTYHIMMKLGTVIPYLMKI